MRLLITRPKEDAKPLVQSLKEQGHDPVLFPLLTIKPETDGAKALAELKVKDVQALLMTSANGVRAFATADKRRSFKVMAVGDATATQAREAGFKDIHSASGDVEALSALIKEKCSPDKGKLVHIAGSRVAGDLKGLLEKDGFEYQRIVLYSAEATTELSATLKQQITQHTIDAVLLYSPRTASAFVDLVEKAKLKDHLKYMVAYGLSAAVASKLTSAGFKEIKTAKTPDQEALLACLSETKDDLMNDTTKKDDPKKTDAKVVDAKADNVKVSPASKAAEPSKSGPTKPEAKKAEDKKPEDKKKADDPVKNAPNGSKAPAQKKGSFKAKLLVASVVIVATAAVAGHFTQDMWLPQVKAEVAKVLKVDVANPQSQRLDELSARLDSLENKPSSETVDIQPIQDKVAELEGAITALKTEISAIEITNTGTGEVAGLKELVQLKAENERLVQLVTELNNRLTDVEAARLAARSSSDNAQALVASLSALREVMRTSAGFESELATLQALAQGDVTLEEGVDQLNAYAKDGISSKAALMASFDSVANDIVRAVAIPEGAGWVEQTVKNITSLVSIRRAPGNQDGDGPLGIVARAEQNVRAGDLAGTVKEFETLDGKPLEAAQGWMAQAKARLDAEAAVSMMQSHILSLLGGAGGQG
jgi:uroporphyrinogen-III synthase